MPGGVPGDAGGWERRWVWVLTEPANQMHDLVLQDLPRGAALTQLPSGGSELTLSVAVLEGHRFALVPIAAGALLLSWGEPFGKALAPIAPGEWVRNAKALHELRRRAVDSAHGAHANFVDFTKQPTLTRDGFAPGVRRPLRPQLAPGFDGFVRSAGRGVGTRNMCVVVGTTSHTAAVRVCNVFVCPAPLVF